MGWAQTTHPLQLYRASSQIQIFPLERHQQLYWVLSLLAAVKVCVSLGKVMFHTWAALSRVGSVPLRTASLDSVPLPTLPMARHTHWSPSTPRIRTFLLSLHLSQDTTKVLQDLSISTVPPSKNRSLTGTEKKRKSTKKEENAFYHKRRKSERYLTPWKHKSWIPSQNNYPRLTFPFSRSKNLNTFPLLLPAQKNGRVHTSLLR